MSKTVLIFHDKITFNSYEDQTLQWGLMGEKKMKPMCRGAGIMLSGFVEEKSVFLPLNDSEYQEAETIGPSIKTYPWEFPKCGETEKDIGHETN